VTPQFHYLKRIRALVLASAFAVVLGVTGVAIPQGDVRGMGGGGLMCGYYTDPSTGLTQMMTGRFFVGRRRWLNEPVAEVASVTLVSAPYAGGNPDLMPKADCIDIARKAMLRDAASCDLPGADALVESALTSPAGVAEQASWWRYLLAVLRRTGPFMTILGCAGLVVYLQLESRRKKRSALEGVGGTLCAHCGYLLAGLAVGDGRTARTVCPECGKAHDDVSEQALSLRLAQLVSPVLPFVIALLVVIALAAMNRF
jgi:hypothetical protein